jgi:RNA polymerase sigma factor (sigma-70 family)
MPDPLARMVAALAADPTPDADLLARFAQAGDPAAFELLVRRHADLVWRVCRGVLRHDHHRVEDAFQATFLALARKAGQVRGPAAGWLFRVARHAALKARAAAARHPGPLPADVPASATADPTAAAELSAVVAEEVARLPARFRDPVVLCLLGGHTHAEAADRLGWPVGTVASRLSRARDRLRGRLERRGVAGVVLSAAGGSAPGALVRTAAAVGAGAVPPAAVVSLTNGVLIAMNVSKLKWATAAVVLGLAGGGSLWAVGTGDDPKPVAAKAPAPPPKAAAKPVPPSLVGTWVHPAATVEKVGGEDRVRKWERKVVITADRILYLDEGGFVEIDAAYKLDPGGVPNTIDASEPWGGTQEGVYRRTGDRLRVAFAAPGHRTDLKIDDGPEDAVLDLKRVTDAPAVLPVRRHPNADGWFWAVSPNGSPPTVMGAAGRDALVFLYDADATGAAIVAVAAAVGGDGRHRFDKYQVVLYDAAGTRHLPANAGAATAASRQEGTETALYRWRMDPKVLPADKVKHVGVEQRMPDAPAKP